MRQIITTGSESSSFYDHRIDPAKASSIDIFMFIKHWQRINRSDPNLIESTSVQQNIVEYGGVSRLLPVP